MRCDPPTQTSRPMQSHANAHLTQKGRFRLIHQHRLHHRPLAELAAEAGICLRGAYKWLARYHSGGTIVLMVRRSVRRTLWSCAISGCTCVTSPGCCTLLFHRGQSLEPPGLRERAESTAPTSSAALRERDTERSDPNRCQEAGSVPQGGASHQRQPAAGPFHRRRLRPGPGGDQRRNTAAGRTDRCALVNTSRCLLSSNRPRRSAS